MLRAALSLYPPPRPAVSAMEQPKWQEKLLKRGPVSLSSLVRGAVLCLSEEESDRDRPGLTRTCRGDALPSHGPAHSGGGPATEESRGVVEEPLSTRPAACVGSTVLWTRLSLATSVRATRVPCIFTSLRPGVQLEPEESMLGRWCLSGLRSGPAPGCPHLVPSQDPRGGRGPGTAPGQTPRCV